MIYLTLRAVQTLIRVVEFVSGMWATVVSKDAPKAFCQNFWGIFTGQPQLLVFALSLEQRLDGVGYNCHIGCWLEAGYYIAIAINEELSEIPLDIRLRGDRKSVV